ncbi:MAG: DNA polymerase I [Rivihabitans pingtungensis]
MKTLLLVDGSSYLYRAFHAMPDLRSPAGEPTGAVYGMINMLKKLEKDISFDYSAVVFDAKGKTFRDELYPEYKAQRPPMPPELAAQITPVHAAVTGLGWPLLMVEGVEADDVIGALAHQASTQGWQVVVSTGDKDMAQLVNAQVTLVNTMTSETLDSAGVQEKFGVPPERIIDFLTLTGDKVDNVPGVDGCGPKTAAKWLAEHGSLDAIIAAADSVKGKAGEKLRAALPHLPLSRQLVTIKLDVDLSAHLADGLASLRHGEPRRDALLALYRQCGFRTWLRELDAAASEPAPPGDLFAEAPAAPTADAAPAASAAPKPAPAPASANYTLIRTQAELDAWLARLQAAPVVSLDTETTSLDSLRARLVGLSFSLTPGEAAYLPLMHRDAGGLLPDQLSLDAALATLKPWLENPQAKKLGQNLKYDRHVLANHGVQLAGVVDDTLLASYVLESHLTHNMDDLAERHLGVSTVSYEALCGKGAKQIGFDEVDIDAAGHYAAEDADITLRLAHAFAPQLHGALEDVYRRIELPTAEVLFAMERTGVLIDRDELARQSHQLGQRIQQLEAHAYELAGQPFNMNSPKQLQEILFGRLGIDSKGLKKTPTGAISVNEDALEKLAADHPLPKLLLEYRGLAKLKSTYTDKLPTMIHPDTGRVHTHYSQAVAVTGRLASSDPNLQNIPVRTEEGRRVRKAFIAPPGWQIVSADYSQIELRIMAHLSDDPRLLQAFADGEDIHRATAAEVFAVPLAEVSSQQRRYAKTINFGLIYGMSAFGLAAQLEIDRSAAQSFIDRYFARYPGVADYMARTREQAREQGYVETVFGRRLWLPDIHAANAMKRQGAERAAINAPMQGTAADLIKLAMIEVQHWLRTENLRSRLIMQVHDELVLEAPADELDTVKAGVVAAMARVAQLKTPLVAEVGSGDNWEAAH